MRRARIRSGLGLGSLCLVWLVASGCESPPSADEPARSPAPAVLPAPDATVRLDEETIRRAGIETATVIAGSVEPEIEAHGRVLDPTVAGDAVATVEAARAAAEAAQRELRRVDLLARGQQNASVREAEAARAGAARAGADLAMAESRLVGALGPTLARSPELSSLVDRLVRREIALARIDVPGSAARPMPEAGAHLAVYLAPDVELAARFVGSAPDDNPSLPGYGLLFLLTDTAPPVGTPLRARLRSAGRAIAGVRLPPEAVLWHDGRLVAFVALARGAFERRPLTADVLGDGTRLVTRGLSAGERVVVSGAAALLSAEILPATSRDPE